MINTAVKTQVKLLPCSTVTAATGDGNPGQNCWKLTRSMLSCGLWEFQGWSSGVGISNNEDLENKLVLLCYFSKNTVKYKGLKWGMRSLAGENHAPIGVPRMMAQWLSPRQNYLLSSQSYWIDRLEQAIKKYELGTFTKTGIVINNNYGGHEIQCGIWTWNGTCPPLSVIGYDEAA